MQNISPIKHMEEISRTMEGVISLSQGIPAGFSDQLIREDVIKAMNENKVDKYSVVAGISELREEISNKLKEQNLHYSPENGVIITAGGMEALATTMFTIIEPDDEVIIITPSYVYYERITKLARGKFTEVPLDESKGWKLDVNKIKDAITSKTKALILCNPNNPTGTLFTKEEQQQLGDLALQYNFYIISDEVYRNLLFSESDFYSLAEDQKYRDCIIRVVSLSKDFNLTGWRIGYLNCPENLYHRLLATHDTLVNCTPVISQYAGLSALRHEHKLLPIYKKRYLQNKQIVESTLNELQSLGKLAYVKPEGTYYVFPKITGMTDSTEFSMNILMQAKISTVPGIGFGQIGEGHIRICFGRETKDVEEGMKRLKDIL